MFGSKRRIEELEAEVALLREIVGGPVVSVLSFLNNESANLLALLDFAQEDIEILQEQIDLLFENDTIIGEFANEVAERVELVEDGTFV